MVDYVFVTEVSSLVATAALVVGLVYGVVQLRAVKEQIGVTVFTTYTQRYMDLMARLPASAYDTLAKGKSVQPISDGELSVIRSFFDLWSEEHYLHTRGLVDRKVWNLWENGIRSHMRARDFRDAWRRVYDPKSERYDAGFVQLLSECVASREPDFGEEGA